MIESRSKIKRKFVQKLIYDSIVGYEIVVMKFLIFFLYKKKSFQYSQVNIGSIDNRALDYNLF